MQEEGLTSGPLRQEGNKQKKKTATSKPKKKKAIMTPSGEMMKPGTNEVMEAAGGEITDMLEGLEPTDPMDYGTEVMSEKTNNVYGRFEIVRSIVLIHTEEQI